MTANTVLVAGMDEAGLGPILGPLTIGFSVFRVPAAETNLWKLLRRRVSGDPKRDQDRLIVADSKRVFARNPRGRRRLEATALTFFALTQEGGRPPSDAHDFLFGDLRPGTELLRRHPWYDLVAELPRFHDAEGIELGAALLGRALDKSGVELVDAGLRLVPSGELNGSYRETDNKAETVWERSLEVMRHLWTRHGREGLDLTVDLLGGRIHYGPYLGRGFPDGSVRMLYEEDHRAGYEIEGRDAQSGHRMRLDFTSRAEEGSFAVALASCFAKYARETVMDAFNAYFAALQPDLKPTAGYYGDGQRWLREASGAVERSGIDRDVLVRAR